MLVLPVILTDVVINESGKMFPDIRTQEISVEQIANLSVKAGKING